MKKINKIYLLLKYPKTTKKLLSLMFSGFLFETGWINSAIKKKPVDKNNKPVIWITNPAFYFIKERIDKKFNVFEFGSGYSTLYFAEKTNHVTSVEHHKEWFDKISTMTPNNSKIIHQTLKEGKKYSETIKYQNTKFEIVLVDGRDRVDCIKNSVKFLTDDGIIILDNSERKIYKEAFYFLRENGFKHIDFYGPSPVAISLNCTTIFYRKNNCINI